MALLETSDYYSGHYVALNTLAAGYLKTSRADRAARLWKHARETADARGDRERVAGLVHNLGIAYQHLGRYDDALRCLLTGFESMCKTGVRRGECRSHYHLGAVYRLTGRLIEAEEHTREGLQISCDIGDRQLEAERLNGLGDICHDAGRSEEAITYYVYDLWVDWWRRTQARGQVITVRFADDFIVGFGHEEDARRFLVELRERLAKFGLELHPDKTRLIEFGRHAARPARHPVQDRYRYTRQTTRQEVGLLCEGRPAATDTGSNPAVAAAAAALALVRELMN